jgi:hypothetical protein
LILRLAIFPLELPTFLLVPFLHALARPVCSVERFRLGSREVGLDAFFLLGVVILGAMLPALRSFDNFAFALGANHDRLPKGTQGLALSVAPGLDHERGPRLKYRLRQNVLSRAQAPSV